ncbi:uncharacterized protein BJ212DRAFT_453217 [Suillus subaureus]|uniref:Uncharacterized protein n=1 Tax=Suillus subaureus TaxID=48587 RepID=A0A9P7JBA6_9AGAM|nr:uncharacterized protein BJ212DRAFT_453217 [Suillus subaureus]KAG1812498.1 hypothetical protein BJ212DRAFT_453217 [Suillus subaureus]
MIINVTRILSADPRHTPTRDQNSFLLLSYSLRLHIYLCRIDTPLPRAPHASPQPQNPTRSPLQALNHTHNFRIESYELTTKELSITIPTQPTTTLVMTTTMIH